MTAPASNSPAVPMEDLLVLTHAEGQTFRAGAQAGFSRRIYGGQGFAQAIMAAAQTVEPDRLVHSAHAYFVRGGDDALPADYEVYCDFDGGRFSNRRVVARQNGNIILSLGASFSRDAGIPAPTMARRDGIPEPEAADPLESYLVRYVEAHLPDPQHIVRRADQFEVRVVNGPLTFGEIPQGSQVHLWFRLKDPIASMPALHRGVLAYFSDFTLLAAGLHREGAVWSHESVAMATIDHALWVHAQPRVDDWILYSSQATWRGQGRAYCRGEFFDRAGRMIGSTTQEGVLRITG